MVEINKDMQTEIINVIKKLNIKQLINLFVAQHGVNPNALICIMDQNAEIDDTILLNSLDQVLGLKILFAVGDKAYINVALVLGD